MCLHVKTLFACLTGMAMSCVFSAEPVSLSGTIQTQACIQSCGTCCGTHGINDTSGNINLQIGNAFVDLTKIADDGKVHQFTGHFYTTAGQCGVGECALFAVEAIEPASQQAATFQAATGRLSIQTVVIDNDTSTSYAVTLSPPYVVESVVDANDLKIIEQGEDCSAENAVCSSGTVCLSYFGIAGPNGPQFKTCEIPCSHPGSICPLAQSCATIADGPGQVCTVD